MPPQRKFLWSSVADTFQKIIWSRNRFTEQEGQTLQINAKLLLMIFLFSFGEFHFLLCEASTEKIFFWEVENYRLPREVVELSNAFLGNLV